MDVQTVQDHVDACFQASLAGIDLAKCRKPGVPVREAKAVRERKMEKLRVGEEGGETEKEGKEVEEERGPRNREQRQPGEKRVYIQI